MEGVTIRGRRRVLFAGYFGAGNLGDEAILAAELARWAEALGEAFEPRVASQDAAATRRFHGDVGTVPSWDLDLLSAAIRESDLVIWGGGGLLQDRWHVAIEDLFRDPRGGIPGYLRVPLLAAAWGIPCMMYAQGVGPIERTENRRLAGAVLNALAAITVRDEGSAALLEACGVDLPITVTADPAFGLEPGALGPDTRVWIADPILAAAPRVPPDGDRTWIDPYVASLDGWTARTGGGIALVVFDHSKEGDLELCREIRGRLARPDAACVYEWLRPAEVAALLGRCAVVLATRLHAMILGAIAGRPFVALDYDPKVRAVAAQLGGPVLPLTGLDAAALSEALRSAAAEGPAQAAARRDAVEWLRRRDEMNLRRGLALLAAGTGRGISASPARRAAEEEIAMRVLAEQRSAALAGDVQRLSTELGSARRAVEDAIATRVLADQRSAALSGDVQRLSTELESARRHLAEALPQLAVVSRELAQVRGSVAGRAAHALWTAFDRLLPAGSARRALYRRLRGLGRPSEDELAAAIAPGTAEPPAPPVPASRDLAGELDAFERRLFDRGVRSVVLLASPTRLLVDEGQRPTQFALELSRRGLGVIFAFWRWSESEAWPQDRLEENVFQLPIDALAAIPDRIFTRFSGCIRRAVFEFPHPLFLEPLAAAHAEGWTTVYDVLDDWEDFHRVGQAIWYREDFERHLLGSSHAVTAVHPVLAERARRLGARDVAVVPNGVARDIAATDGKRRLPRGRVTVGYFGYLAGAWFDWELIARAAAARPKWKFYLIGYGGSPEGIPMPPNVVLLGRIPQRELAGYAASWDVAIVPFKDSALAAGADPIKIYEYLAMGLPVVVTGVSAPAGAEAFVTRAADLPAFLSALEAAKRSSRGRAARVAWAAECTWEKRVEGALAAVEHAERGDVEKRRLFGAGA